MGQGRSARVCTGAPLLQAISTAWLAADGGGWGSLFIVAARLRAARAAAAGAQR